MTRQVEVGKKISPPKARNGAERHSVTVLVALAYTEQKKQVFFPPYIQNSNPNKVAFPKKCSG